MKRRDDGEKAFLTTYCSFCMALSESFGIALAFIGAMLSLRAVVWMERDKRTKLGGQEKQAIA
jgi:hypothetical protein